MSHESACSRPHPALDQPSETFLSIREAQLEDFASVAKLLTESFHADGWFRWLAPALRLGIYQDLRSRYLNPPRYYACLIGVQKNAATSQERLVGTVEVALRSLSPFPTDWMEYPYISNLAVSPDFRQQGIAQRLLLACERTVQTWGLQDLYLHVLQSNVPARQLYAKVGFQVESADLLWLSYLLGRPQRLFLHKRL